MADTEPLPSNCIAVVGMSGRFPGARSIDELWRNLVAGVESITRFTDDELRASGINPSLIENPDYVKARGLIDGPELFDAAFFGISHREAELMDPQQRLFLETCWLALEHAAIAPSTFSGPIGVWGGMSTGMTNNTYLLSNLHSQPGLLDAEDVLPAMLGNENDYLTTRVSYKLHLRGPSINVQSACSTSLVAIVQAVQALLTWQCDAALAGGVSVSYPQRDGYLFQEGGIGSPDGHCRAFDKDAQGTVFSNGVGVVVLRRLEDALADRQPIYAVIRGAALNNDGSSKVSFAAPSVEGQADVIATAHAIADVLPDSIGYVEAHGTGTPLGDPIEVTALTKAFRAGGATGRQFCALGSVKSNFGHLDSAAGVTGFIKAVLALHHGRIPPTLHFQSPNPRLNLPESPFYVNADARDWQRGDRPRRAGVSSFGIGGTNAHVVLEEAPEPTPAADDDAESVLLVLSAKTETAVREAGTRLADALAAEAATGDRALTLADAAYTLQVGRQAMPHRRAYVCGGRDEAIALLRAHDPRRVISGVAEQGSRSMAFLFPGGGTQYVQMGRDLLPYAPVFREEIERCLEILRPSRDLRPVLFAATEDLAEAIARLEQPSWGLPALFAVEYALARQWMAWGVTPDALIGHSMGEYTAACLAGVMSLEDALAVVLLRGRLFETLAPGEMVGVPLSEAEVLPLLGPGLAIAAVNAPSSCVVSGPPAALSAFAAAMEEDGVECRRLHIAVAAHSPMVEPILREFEQFFHGIELQPPSIPVVSNVTGTWMTADDACSPEYWARHLRQTVRFFDGLGLLMREPNRVLLECGPGQTLSGFVRQHPDKIDAQLSQASLRHPKDATPDIVFLQQAVGRLWTAGVPIDWNAFTEGEERRRVVLPPYAFDRKRYLIEPSLDRAHAPVGSEAAPPRPALSTVMSHHPHPTGPSPSAPPAPVRPRADRICDRLTELLHKLSGLPVDEIDPNVSFLEMGFDSLFLTQASLRFKNEFKVRIGFRQLFEEAPTLTALASYIDGKLPADAFPAPAAPAAVPAAAAPVAVPQAAPPAAQQFYAPVPQAPMAPVQMPQFQFQPAVMASPQQAGAAAQIIQYQLQLMAEQLRVLGTPVSAFAPLAGAAYPQASPVMPEAAAFTPAAPVVAVPEAAPAAPVASAAAAVTPEPAKTEPTGYGRFRPIDRSNAPTLSAGQQRALDAWIARYTKRTAGSKRVTAGNRPALADPRSVAGFNRLWKEMIYPIVSERSAGSKIWDVDGNEYVDLVMGYGSNLFGHRPAFIQDAVEAQLKQGFEIGPLQPVVGDVASLVSELTGMERVAFTNTGSEAVLVATRIARTVTGRERVAVFDGSYHGVFDEMLLRHGPTNRNAKHTPAAPGVPASAVSQVTVMDYADPASSLATLREHGEEIAAVLVEPVQSRRLDLQPRDFMHELRRVTNEIGAALIFDEVITGFRSHPGGAQAYFGVRADIATYGKVVGGGLPIGVVAGSGAYLDALDGGAWQFGDASFPEVGVTYFAGTFVRHPLALASARAVLTHLKQNPMLQQTLAGRTAGLADRLRALIRQYNAPYKLTNFSSIMHLSTPPDQRYAGLLFYLLRDYGIHAWEGFPLFITTAHTDADFDVIAHALDRSLAEMQAAGFFGDTPSGGPPTSGKKTTEPAVVPFTESQLEIYIGSGMSEASSRSFNEVVALDVKGPLDLGAMQKAMSQVVARHESLRMKVSAEPLGFTLADRVDVPLEYEDVSGLPAAERDAAVDALMRSGDSVTFDLTQGPLLRLTLMKTAPDTHLFVLVAHHLVCDGLSFGIVLHDLYTSYSALVTGGVADLPEPVSAVAFAHEASQPEQVEARAEAERFWVSQFATLPDPLELPADRPRPAVRSYDGERIALTLRPEVARAVKALATGQRATMFTTLLAGFVTLVSRLSGQDDFVIGIPVAGQSLLENQELVAHCVSFVPLRCRTAKDPTFLSQLAAARQQSLDINEYHNFTYGSLLNKLRLPRDPSRDPLVTISFTVEPAIDNLAFHGLTAAMRTVPRTTAKRDLHVNVTDTADGLLVEADFNRGMYDRATVARWLESYGHLLEAAVAAPAAPIAQLAMLSAADRDRVLTDWNATRAAYPSDRLVHQMIEAHAVRVPGSPALVHEQQRLTWRELNARANQIARALVRAGVGAGTIVGICLERSADFVASLMAAHKAGAAYVPLDPAYPSERLAFLLGDARVAATITHASLVSRVPAPGPVVVLGGPDDAAARESAENLDRPVDLDALAYVIYTSGSTGTPKGVAVPHRQLINYVHAINERLALPADASYALVSTVAADLGMTSIYPPLSTGGVIHVVTQDRATDARALAGYLASERVDVLKITPSHLDALLQQHRTASLLPARCLVIAGEVARASWVAELRALAPRCAIVNSYGPTETTVGAMTYEASERPALATGDWLPIGTPMGNVRVYVLDAGGALAPIGVPGELFIGGAGVARGYLHRDELTAEKFVRDPFVSASGARMYRTGDRVRWLADGTMEFLGRVDHQVKIRGYRVELGEIEGTLRTHPAIEDAVVLLREDVPGDPRVIAYVRGRAVDAAELRAHAKRSLPEHAIPAAFVALDAFPLTPNGKIDRKALPAPSVEAARPAAGPVSLDPSTAIEKKLAAMWTEVLSVRRVGVRDDFFLLGGHSLLAMRLVGRLHKEFGVALTPGALFQYSTLGELASHVESRMPAPPAPPPAAARERDAAASAVTQAATITPAATVTPAVPPARHAPSAAVTPQASSQVVQFPGAASRAASGGTTAALLDDVDPVDAPVAAVAELPAPRRLPQKVLVQLAAGGQGLPFFWVHGVGGEVFSYLHLSRHLAANRPVYGFTADWSQIAGGRMPTLEEMAAAYVAEMRAVQRQGPYFIGGFCSAAMLALEVARQLEAENQKVGLLAAIDYDLVPVETSPRGLRAIAAFLRNMPRWVREDAIASGPKELFGRLRSKLRGWLRASSGDKQVDFRDHVGMWRFPDYQVPMLKAHHQAIHSYQPKSLNGKVALFLPRTAPLLGPWPKGHGADWDYIARGGVEVHRVCGSHATLLREPFVEALGTCLNACIEQVERESGEPPARAPRQQSPTPAVATAMTAMIS